MCLTVTFFGNSYDWKRGRPFLPSIAEEDIRIYKFLDHDYRRKWILFGPTVKVYRAPIRKTRWTLGKLTRSRLGTPVFDSYRTEFNVEKGLHAFENAVAAYSLRVNHEMRGLLYIGYIPKGAKYFYGDRGDIVSDRMVVERLAVADDFIGEHCFREGERSYIEHRLNQWPD